MTSLSNNENRDSSVVADLKDRRITDLEKKIDALNATIDTLKHTSEEQRFRSVCGRAAFLWGAELQQKAMTNSLIGFFGMVWERAPNGQMSMNGRVLTFNPINSEKILQDAKQFFDQVDKTTPTGAA